MHYICIVCLYKLKKDKIMKHKNSPKRTYSIRISQTLLDKLKKFGIDSRRSVVGSIDYLIEQGLEYENIKQSNNAQ